MCINIKIGIKPKKMTKKLISIVTPCLNEEDNIEAIYEKIKSIFLEMKDYEYEHIFIDNK